MSERGRDDDDEQTRPLFLSPRKLTCGEHILCCKYCDFWVGVERAETLVRHMRDQHYRCALLRTVASRVGCAQAGASTSSEFEILVGTDLGDEEVWELLARTRKMVHFSGEVHLSMAEIRIEEETRVRTLYLCPYCRLVLYSAEESKQHAFDKHLKIIVL